MKYACYVRELAKTIDEDPEVSYNKRKGATQEETRVLSGMRLILVRVVYLAM